MNILMWYSLQGNPYCQGSLSGDDGKTCFCAQFCIISSEQQKIHWPCVENIESCIELQMKMKINFHIMVRGFYGIQLHGNKQF
jgi:hypothetical protein